MPDETEPGIVALHLKRYEFARPYCVGKHVLDAGCGVGYGSAFLGEAARSVVGVDVSGEAIDYARARYGGRNVEFDVGDLQRLERADAEFDAVVLVRGDRARAAAGALRGRGSPRGEARTACSSSRRLARSDGATVADEPVPRARVRPRRVRAPAAHVVRTRRASTGSAASRRGRHRALQRLDVLGPSPPPAVPATRVEPRHRDGADGRRSARRAS